MTYLNRNTAQELLNTRPEGTSVQDALKTLSERGFTVEGYNDGKEQSINESLLSKVGNSIGNTVEKRVGNIKEGLKEVPQAYNQETDNKVAGVVGAGLKAIQQPLNIAGQVAGAGLDILGKGIEKGVEAIPEGIKQDVGGDISKLVASPLGQKVKSDLSGDWENFKGSKLGQAILGNPDLTRAIENTVNVASVVPIGQGVKTVATAGKDALGTVIKDTSNLVKKTSTNIKNNINIAKGLKTEQRALEAITPDVSQLSANEYEKLLQTKKIKPREGATGKPEYVLSEDEINLAKKHSSILQNSDPAKNSINIMNEIANTDAKVGAFLDKNNGIFNTGKLKNRLKDSLSDIQDLTIPEARLNKLKTSIIDSFLKGLDKNDMKTLWAKRKAFDSQIENAFKGSYSVTKDVKVKFRNAIQDFIADNTPDNVYKGFMKDMSNLYKINDVVASKASSEKNANAIMSWIKKNPTKAKIIGYTAGSGATVGVIGSLIK